MTTRSQRHQTIGILGGGQLGRMLAQAAKKHGYRSIVFTGGTRNSPAGQIADAEIAASFQDEEALMDFSQEIAAATYEFENVPFEAVSLLNEEVHVRPGALALAISQDRHSEKSFLQKIGVPTAAFAFIDAEGVAEETSELLTQPTVLKTSQGGYDGKGQKSLPANAILEDALEEFKGRDCILEERIAIAKEFSVIGARNSFGESFLYEPIENIHRDHILSTSLLPSELTREVSAQAKEIVRTILDKLCYVGVLCVEFFLDEKGRVLVNEIAPRPHNSGHLTIEAFDVSQFELQLFSTMNTPFPQPTRLARAAIMINVLGEHWEHFQIHKNTIAAKEGVFCHDYGKGEAREKRKMGHITLMGDSASEVSEKAKHIESILRLDTTRRKEKLSQQRKHFRGRLECVSERKSARLRA